MIPSQHIEIVHELVQIHLDGDVQEIADKSLGFSGSFVYSVHVARGNERLHCIAKFTPAEHAADDSVTNRVYGSLASNFNSAYLSLQQHQVPLPKLYATCTPQPDIPYYCQLMEYLPGEEVRSALKSTPAEKQSALQYCLGRELGVIHRIMRTYDGWIDLATPNPLGWREAFFLALYETLDAARNHPFVAVQLPAIAQAIAHFESKWVDPIAFVLAHGDGLQGMVVETLEGWQLTGVFDIEDYIYSDQRFVLSVFELEAEIDAISIQPSFWTAYETQRAIDPTYRQLRSLFQLYVLLDWIKGMSPEDEMTRQLSRMIGVLARTQ